VSQAWNSPEREITPEGALFSRRKLLVGGGIAGGLLAAGGLGYLWYRGSDDEVLSRGRFDYPASDLYPAVANEHFLDAGRSLTVETDAARYCNFFEFSSTKAVWRQVGPFEPVPWTVEIAGLVEQPKTYDIDQLARLLPLEERIYRHRCVEAWAMVVPWTGFPLAALLKKVGARAGAKFVLFETFDRPRQASRQADRGLPWPYTEGLTLAEAMNELTFIATGMYGHPLEKQHGAPLRLVVPWKYGYKSAKSLVRITVTDQQPRTFWNTLVPYEYDFQANVNPGVPHPRWSQRSERMLGTGERHETRLYNGYGDWVAKLYES
jgi:methionine sulfoxide reductase catalytic subunit